jgi:hypothetical protein
MLVPLICKPPAFQDSLENHLELCRLLAAAVVDPNFCRLLLARPDLALADGYRGETFLFDEQERALLVSIRTDSLPELAWQIDRALGGQAAILADRTVPLEIIADR